MTKIDTLKSLIEYSNLTEAEIREFSEWLLTKYVNAPTFIALEHCEDIDPKDVDSVDDLQQHVFDEDLHSDLIEDIGTKSWYLIDWDYIYRRLKQQG